jgi:hypothetical protein
MARRADTSAGSDPHRSDRVGRGLAPRLLLGAVLGPLVGALAGLGIGAWAFTAGSRGMWACVVAGALFGLLLGGFWGGMAGLGPPAPEDDPLPRRD